MIAIVDECEPWHCTDPPWSTPSTQTSTVNPFMQPAVADGLTTAIVVPMHNNMAVISVQVFAILHSLPPRWVTKAKVASVLTLIRPVSNFGTPQPWFPLACPTMATALIFRGDGW